MMMTVQWLGDEHSSQPSGDVAQHLLRLSWPARVDGDRSRTAPGRSYPGGCHPCAAAHHAAPKDKMRPAAVKKPVRTAARRALSAAWRAAVTAASTRCCPSSWEIPARCATTCARQFRLSLEIEPLATPAAMRDISARVSPFPVAVGTRPAAGDVVPAADRVAVRFVDLSITSVMASTGSLSAVSAAALGLAAYPTFPTTPASAEVANLAHNLRPGLALPIIFPCQGDAC